MKKFFIATVLTLLAVCAAAQWSSDPLNPNLINGAAGEQVLPKVAVTTSGTTYICRFDNGGGGYSVYLNLLGPDGTPLWTEPNGLLVSNHTSMSWLTEYDMTCDNEGNAVIVFQDIRNAGVNNVYAYKISPQGAFLWGADGIALTSDTNTEISNMSPVVFNSADNSSYVGWQRMSTATELVVQRISPEGTLLWGTNGLLIGVTGASCTWPQIIQGDGNNILLKYYQDSGPFWAPNRHVYVAKYTPQMEQVWSTVMSNAGGIAAWEQIIPFEPDGAGGAALAWYEDRESDMDNDVYCQHVNTSGSVTMPLNGALVSQDPVNQQFYPFLAIDTANQQIFAFFSCTDGNQNLYGLGRQMLDFSGTRLWGETAPMEIPISATYVNTVGAYYTDFGAVCLYEYADDNLYAGCWRASGNMGWSEGVTLIAGSADSRYHFDVDTHPDNWAVLAWEQGMTNMDVYAMRINGTGLLGPEYLAPRNLAATLLPPNIAQLTWQQPSLYVPPESYYIYMDGELAQTVGSDVTTYQIPNLSPGEHLFYLKAGYPGGHYSPQTETVSLLVVSADDPVQTPSLAELKLGPNPCAGSLQLSFTSDKAGIPYRLGIYNLRGQRLWTRQGATLSGVNSLSLDLALEGLRDSGIYLIKIETPDNVITSRILRLR